MSGSFCFAIFQDAYVLAQIGAFDGKNMAAVYSEVSLISDFKQEILSLKSGGKENEIQLSE